MNRHSGKLAPRPTLFPKPSHRLPGTTIRQRDPPPIADICAEKQKNMIYSTNINEFLLNFARDGRCLGI